MDVRLVNHWQRYVDELRDNLRLCQWNVTVVAAPPQNEAATASIFAEDQRNAAELHLSAKFLIEPKEVQRYCLTHELMHLHLWRYMQYANSITDHLGGQARMIAQTELGILLELANDEIAQAIAMFLPLPGPAEEDV